MSVYLLFLRFHAHIHMGGGRERERVISLLFIFTFGFTEQRFNSSIAKSVKSHLS